MTIKILFFASLAERLGVREIEMDLPLKSRVGQLLDRLTERYAELTAVRETLAVAVNLAYVGEGEVLADGDEVALIPPVSGG